MLRNVDYLPEFIAVVFIVAIVVIVHRRR